MRVQNARGWRVVKVSDDGGTIYRSDGDGMRAPQAPPPVPDSPKKKVDLSSVWARCFASCSFDMANDLASELGLRKGVTLSLMGLGWHPDMQCWIFPMYAADFETINGLRTRDASGAKMAVRGSSDGLFGYPGVLDKSRELLVCEGPTDTAVAIELGFQAVGRPSCRGARNIVREIAGDRDVVIVSDSDEPGRRGADDLASKLFRIARSVKIVRPPAKDLREWYSTGIDKGAMQFLINHATALEPRHA